MASITFVCPVSHLQWATVVGAHQFTPTQKGTVKHSVIVAARRGEGTHVRVSATPVQDVVVLQINNGPSLTFTQNTRAT